MARPPMPTVAQGRALGRQLDFVPPGQAKRPVDMPVPSVATPQVAGIPPATVSTVPTVPAMRPMMAAGQGMGLPDGFTPPAFDMAPRMAATRFYPNVGVPQRAATMAVPVVRSMTGRAYPKRGGI